MIKLKDLLIENNYQDLYHFRSIAELFKIIESDQLGVYSKSGVSLTRNKNFGNQSKVFKNMEVRITIDGNKLRQNYKLVPYHWGADKFWNRKNEPINNFEDQQEEQTTKPIQNFNKYVIETLIKEVDLWDYLDEDRWDDLGPLCRYFRKLPEEITYNDLEQYLLKSKFKVKIQ